MQTITTATRIQKAFILAAVLLLALPVACSRKQSTTPLPGTPSQVDGRKPGGTPPASGASAEIPSVGMVAEPTPPPQAYIVQAGDTLGGIAARFGCDLQSLVKANGITDPNALQVGQKLEIPSPHIETGPAVRLLPDSEFVNGPAYANFDVASFVAGKGGYLADYAETVGSEVLTGSEIVLLVAHHYSVGPRLLLALVELKGGWVTQSGPVGQPLGYNSSGQGSFSRQLAWAADKLNQGYYDWRGRGMQLLTWPDGTVTRYASSLNAATAGLQYFFAVDSPRSEWQTLVGDGPGSFLATYRALFGDPQQYAIEPLIPADLENPAWALPWSQGETWHFTGAPHGAWEDGSAWAAMDFVPAGGPFGCGVPESWATAAASGLVIYSQNGEVLVDLDEDGHEQTGWVLFYLHMAGDGRVAVDTRVRTGDAIGRPSCEGGFSESAHLHLARKYNGEWIAADGPLPFTLSGWQPHSGGEQYDGTLTRGAETREACECWDPATNGLTADR